MRYRKAHTHTTFPVKLDDDESIVRVAPRQRRESLLKEANTRISIDEMLVRTLRKLH